jgi:hypothetical protein
LAGTKRRENWRYNLPRETQWQDPERMRELLHKSITIFLFILIGLLAVDAKSQVPQPLTLVQTIPLPGLKDGD